MPIDMVVDPPMSPSCWDEFFVRCEQRMLWHMPEYSACLQAAVGGQCHVLCAVVRDKIVGIVRFFRKEVSAHGVVYNSAPWYGHTS